MSDNFGLTFGFGVGLTDLEKEEVAPVVPGGTPTYEYHPWFGWEYVEIGVSFSW